MTRTDPGAGESGAREAVSPPDGRDATARPDGRGAVARPGGDGAQDASGPLPIATPARTRAVVRRLAAPFRGAMLGGFAVLVAGTAVGLLAAPLLGHIVDLVAAGRPPEAITVPALSLAAIALVQGAAGAYGVGLIARAGEGMLAALRERFVDRALRLPLRRIESAGAGDLTSRVTNDVAIITEVVREAVPSLARASLTIVLTLAAMAVLDWRFLLVALLAVPFQIHTLRWYVGRAGRLYAAQRVAVAEQQQRLLGTIAGAETVRALRRSAAHVERVAERSEAAMDLSLRGARLVTRFFSRLNLAEFVGLAAVLATGFWLVRLDAVSVGTASAAALYFHSLFTPINVVLGLVDDVMTAMSGLARLAGVADSDVAGDPWCAAAAGSIAARPDDTAIRDGTATRHDAAYRDGAVRGAGVRGGAAPSTDVVPLTHVATGTGAGRSAGGGGASLTGRPDLAVRVRGAGYAYRPGRMVLRDVDLDVAVGERVALVGTSGAGKTTLARLIAGIDRPLTGSVEVRGPVALVTQEVHVFAGPLSEDLALACPAATEERLRAALARVGALGWVEALPDGLRTVVGEDSHRLTPAQAQQLALARVVLADPAVVVLDEATAEAGSAGARELERAAAAATEGKATLVIAHRLTQAAAADRVVVLDAGRVAEWGTHDALAAGSGPYARLWRAWSRTR